MSSILSLKTAQSLTAKEKLKIAIGRGLSAFCQNRSAELQNVPTSHADRIQDRLIMAFLRNRARIRNDTAFFESLHREFWAGDGGAEFSANCDHRFQDLFLAKQRQEFDLLKSHWMAGNFEHIVEIGCCSGLLLQHLVTELPGVTSAVGIDVNPKQIAANQQNADFDKRIDFQCVDGLDYVLSRAKPQTLYVTNGGVLEYFSRQQLNQMISRLAKVGNNLFFAVEPIAPDHDWTETRETIPFGQELSFSHNYRDIFQSNGFGILHQRNVDFESWRLMATIATSKP